MADFFENLSVSKSHWWVLNCSRSERGKLGHVSDTLGWKNKTCGHFFSSHKIFNLTKFWLQFLRKMTTLLRFLAVIDFGKTSIYSFRFLNLWVSDHNSNKIRFYCQSPKSCENNHFFDSKNLFRKNGDSIWSNLIFQEIWLKFDPNCHKILFKGFFSNYFPLFW